MKIINDGTERFLTDEERELLRETARTKKVFTFDGVRKLLKMKSEEVFNLVNYSSKETRTTEETEKKTNLFKMDRSYDIRKALSEEKRTDEKLLDEIGDILSRYKSDERRLNAFAESKICTNLSDEEKDNLLELDFSTFGSLSLKAMRNILPYLEEGQKYNEACAAAGYDFRSHNNGDERLKTLRGEEIKSEIDSVMNPVVRRSISQTVKVLNAIIDKYGSPCVVNIELARELAKNFGERQQIKRDNETREVEYQKIRERLKNEYHVLNPKGIDVLKFRLYNEQGGKCAYSQNVISINKLFEPNEYQIDHIIPYSRSFDDSFSNKVLVLTSENQNKRNRTPYEYMGDNTEKWTKFESFVNAVYNTKFTKKKKENLLRRSFTEENEKDWKSRHLNDTRYITRIIYNLIKDYLLFDSIDGKVNHVVAVNGKITSDLRNLWGLRKVREDGDKHHALDACVIACTSQGMIKRLTEYTKSKERYFNKLKQSKRVFYENGERMYVDEDGVVISEKEFDIRYCREKEVYDGFRNEVAFRLMENPSVYADEHYALLQRLGYSNEEIDNVKPVFVSRMPKRKAKGAIHEETLRSAREKDNNLSVIKTPLSKLKLKNGEIENYNEQAKKDDRLLYEALLGRLKEFDGKADKAFAEPFYKPTSDGGQGNVVKKVLINNVFNAGVFLKKRNVIADNGSMARVDVFIKDGKYYCVPIYVKDVYAQVLPNKAISRDRKYNDWDEIDDSYRFMFSLFSNDLIYIKSKKAFNLTPSNSKEKQNISMNEGLFYYKTLCISTGSSNIITHDNGYTTNVFFKTALMVQKYTVDVLGNITPVKSEKRMPLALKNK